MPERDEFFVRMNDTEAGKMLKELAVTDLRKIGDECAWLIRQEYARRYSAPQPLITVEQAQAAGEAIS